MKDVLILDGLRTPFGNFGGLLKNFSAIDLGVIAVEKLLEKLSFPKESIDHVVFGNVIQSSKDAIYLARHIGLKKWSTYQDACINGQPSLRFRI